MKKSYEVEDVNLVSFTYDMNSNRIEFELMDMYEGITLANFMLTGISAFQGSLVGFEDDAIPAYLGKVTVTQSPDLTQLGSYVGSDCFIAAIKRDSCVSIEFEGWIDVKILCMDCKIEQG